MQMIINENNEILINHNENHAIIENLSKPNPGDNQESFLLNKINPTEESKNTNLEFDRIHQEIKTIFYNFKKPNLKNERIIINNDQDIPSQSQISLISHNLPNKLEHIVNIEIPVEESKNNLQVEKIDIKINEKIDEKNYNYIEMKGNSLFNKHSQMKKYSSDKIDELVSLY